MRVKIFTDEAAALDTKINSWLSKNPNIEVIDRQATSAAGTNSIGRGYICLMVLIWYKEKK